MVVHLGAQDLKRAVTEWLELTSVSFPRHLVPLGAPDVSSVKPRETARVGFYLEAGVRYGVLSTCVCDELEVAMHDAAGLVLAPRRTERGNDVALWVTPAASGRVAFDVTPDECSSRDERCTLGTQLFRVD